MSDLYLVLDGVLRSGGQLHPQRTGHPNVFYQGGGGRPLIQARHIESGGPPRCPPPPQPPLTSKQRPPGGGEGGQDILATSTNFYKPYHSCKLLQTLKQL